ncbi:MAG: hypothetical protein WCK35_14705 [Chloroflexota bacterium]
MLSNRPIRSGRKINTKSLQVFLRVCLLLGIFGWELCFAIPTQAQTENFQLEVIPSEIEIFPGREAEAQITFKNFSDNKIQNIQLSFFPNPNLKIELINPTNSNLEPQGALPWFIKVSQIGTGELDEVIQLRAVFLWKPEGGENYVPGVVKTSIQVKTYTPVALQVLPDLQIKTVLTNLIEGQPGIVYVVINNPSKLPILIKNIIPDGPDFVKFAPAYEDINEVIRANESHVFRYTLETNQSVTPGKYLLLFKVEFAWKSSNYEWPGAVIATHDMDVSILGESGIMSMLGLTTAGIPIFLILPGFLMIVTIGILWHWLTPQAGEYVFKNLLEALKLPEFWFWIFTLSFVMIPIYSAGSRYLGTPRDLLRGYGFIDVAAVWFASIFLAAGSFCGYAILKKILPLIKETILSKYEDWKRKQNTPTRQDTPIIILNKLTQQPQGFLRERASLTINEQQLESPVYLLEAFANGKETYWVSSRIKVAWKAHRTEKENELFESIKNDLSENINAVGALNSKLIKAYQEKMILLSWEATEPFPLVGPHLVEIKNLQRLPDEPRPIIFMEIMID